LKFDRINKAKGTSKDKLHCVSWCGIAHAHRDETGAYSYEQLILTARQLNLGQDSIMELFKRAIFN
jgi:serine/threonine-protein kinase HipA